MSTTTTATPTPAAEAAPRTGWSLGEIRAIHDLPLPELLFRAQQVHRQHHDPEAVQLASLLSVKTGGCQEDCAYCPQSAHHDAMDAAPAPAGTPRPSGVRKAERFLQVDEVLQAARRAKEAGASRFCMGAAWREVKDGPAFDRVLDMVRGVRDLGMEACVTLGMLNDEQARRLKDAGLCAYNHNLDTSRSFYGHIIGTRTYDDRLATLRRAREAGLSLCTGGIIGMGESVDDRCLMLQTLSALDPPPESVPINALVPVEGTPLGGRPPVDPLELVRMIGTARIVLPRSRVRLSAGRLQLSREAQVLCFTAGANSIFYGERLLTTGNPAAEADLQLLRDAGLRPLGAA